MPSRFFKLYFCAFFLVLLPSITSAFYYGDIEIISSNDNGITFQLKINNPEEYISLISNDTVYNVTKTVLVAIPPGSDVVISSTRCFEPISPGSLTGKNLRLQNNFLAEVVQKISVRDRQIAVINIYPFYQNIFYGQVEVSIEFNGAVRKSDLEYRYFDDKLFNAVYGYSVLNFDQMKHWPVERKRPVLAKADQSPFSQISEWYKITTTNEGMIEISGQDLISAGISLENLHIDSIHLFYGGGEPIPPENDIPGQMLNEISIMIADGDDGYFNNNDYFVFFAEGADRWQYPSDSLPVFLENLYTNGNCYWLAISGDFNQPGKKMVAIDGSPTGSADTTISSGRFYSWVGPNSMLYSDVTNHTYDFYNWYWTNQASFTFYESFPNIIEGESAQITLRAKIGSGITLYVNNVEADLDSRQTTMFNFSTDRLISGLNKFSLNLDSSQYAAPYLDYCQFMYTGYLESSGEILDFTIDNYTGLAELVVENQFSDDPYVFDLTDPDNPVVINGAVISSEEVNFNYQITGNGRKRFYLCSNTKIYPPESIKAVTITDLRNTDTQVDMFIIAPERFTQYLEEYVQYREDANGINVSLVSLEQILNQFSFGLYDPKAIREFLKYTFNNYPDPVPSAVLLVGDATYDFENNLNTTTINYIPPYIHSLDSSSSDDNYVFFGQFGLLDSDTSYTEEIPFNRGYDMMISRWPVRTASEISTVIEKIKSYESSTSFGPWRTTITLVADDEFSDDSNSEGFHTEQTEELQQPPRLPASFRRNKIYLMDYPYNSSHEKPEVNKAIIRSFNEGTLLINYIGHGNPNNWAHEHVFNKDNDLPQLNNTDQLTLVLTASCSIGFFDSPIREGMAEEFLRYSGGGAVGVISATRVVFSSDNAAFNRKVFETLFGSDGLSIGQAIFAAKLLRQNEGSYPRPRKNDRNYTYFGDPFLKLCIPHYNIRFNELPDSLLALDHHTVAGDIVEINGDDTSHFNFNGLLEIFVYDSDIKKDHKIISSDKVVSYSLNGPVVYRGVTEVVNGYFDFSFIVPLDIGYGGQTAKISVYAESSDSDAQGLADSIPVCLDILSVSDSIGPTVQYTFGDRVNFISGDKITSGDTMTLAITDSSGINLTGSLGHAITLVIDNNVENMVNLTDLFQYDAGNYISGTIKYGFDQPIAGTHSFKVKVWDNANNSSVVEFEVEVISGNRLMLVDLMNYPNPMNDMTTFSFSLTSPAKRAVLEIFTLSGRRIKRIEKKPVPSGYNEFDPWYGRDVESDRVATGVYIYKVTAVSELSDEVVESYGKVIVTN